jgi:hypothetical protein
MAARIQAYQRWQGLQQEFKGIRRSLVVVPFHEGKPGEGVEYVTTMPAVYHKRRSRFDGKN